MIRVGGSCFCGSFLAKVIRQMLSLWHQRSNLKWREIKKYIKNKRVIHLDWLLSIVIFVCSLFWYFNNKNTIKWNESIFITVMSSPMSEIVVPLISDNWQNQVYFGRPFTLIVVSLLPLDTASPHTQAAPLGYTLRAISSSSEFSDLHSYSLSPSSKCVLPPQRHSGRTSGWTKE